MVKQRKSKKRSRRILDGGENITIIIRDFEGKRYEISVNTDETIKQLIEKCKEQSPIDEKEFQYILALGGKILSEEKNISEYIIRTESTLELMKKELLWEFKTVNYQQNNLYGILEPNKSIEKHSKVDKEISDELNNGWEIANVFYRYRNIGNDEFPEILYKKKMIQTSTHSCIRTNVGGGRGGE